MCEKEKLSLFCWRWKLRIREHSLVPLWHGGELLYKWQSQSHSNLEKWVGSKRRKSEGLDRPSGFLAAVSMPHKDNKNEISRRSWWNKVEISCENKQSERLFSWKSVAYYIVCQLSTFEDIATVFSESFFTLIRWNYASQQK